MKRLFPVMMALLMLVTVGAIAISAEPAATEPRAFNDGKGTRLLDLGQHRVVLVKGTLARKWFKEFGGTVLIHEDGTVFVLILEEDV